MNKAQLSKKHSLPDFEKAKSLLWEYFHYEGEADLTILNTLGDCVYVSSPSEGYDQLAGKNLKVFLSGEALKEFENGLERAKLGKTTTLKPTSAYDDKKQLHLYESILMPFSKNGESDLILCFSHDITDRVQSGKLNLTLEAHSKLTSDSFSISDEEFRVIYTSGMTDGWTKENIVGKTTKEIVGEERGDFLISKYLEARELKKSVSVKEWIKRPDGKDACYHMEFNCLNYPDGSVEYLSVVRDITDKENNKIEMEEASKWSALGQISAGVAHEINNPLSIIDLQLKSLLNNRQRYSQEEIDKKINSAIKSVSRINSIVQGLNTYSSPGKNNKLEKIKLEDIVKDNIDLFRTKLVDTDVKIDYLNETKSTYVECRPDQISQVLINLLNNAFQEVQKLQDQWIKVTITAQDKVVKISVIDSGNGIESEIVQNIFNPFFTTKDVGKGMGLGLSLSKSIIEDHSGSLYYQTNKGNTGFNIELNSCI
jgi:PAS domain S-box-containing protein